MAQRSPKPAPTAPVVTKSAGEDHTRLLQGAMLGLVRHDIRDLSARQLGVFLTCYLIDGDHTVRGLAAALNVSKPAITRALDRLEGLDFARRREDPRDRRSVLVKHTAEGAAFLRTLKGIMVAVARAQPA